MRSKSSISVIMTVYNGKKYIDEAIKSVLDQTYSPIEFIVIDDGSTDNSSAIVKKYKDNIRYEFQKNAGLPAAQNKGISLATSDYLAFVDADDLWTPDKLESQIEAFKSNINLEAIFGYVQQFYSPDVRSKIEGKIQCPENPVPGYIAQSMLIKRKSFLRVGMFSEKWTIGPFIEWFLRAQELQLQHVMLDGVVLKRRIHENNMGIQYKNKQTDYVRILKEALVRRRKQAADVNEK